MMLDGERGVGAIQIEGMALSANGQKQFEQLDSWQIHIDTPTNVKRVREGQAVTIL